MVKLYTIETTVPVGKSYKSKGWTVNRKDISELFPVTEYENDYTLLIDGYSSFCRLKFNPRLFFNDNKLVRHLKNLHDEDPKQRIPLEIHIPENRLYKNFINDYKYFEEINYIDMDFKVGKSFAGGCGNIPLTLLGSFIPLNEYDEHYDITVDGINSRGRLNLLTRFYFNNAKLLSYLSKLYDNEPNQLINGKMILPKSKDVEEPQYYISSSDLLGSEKLENILDWDEVKSYVSVNYNTAFKNWIVDHKINKNAVFIRTFPSKEPALLDAVLYLKSHGIVKFK